MEWNTIFAEVVVIGSDARGSIRRIVNFAAFVREAGATAVRTKVSDLSETGCSIQGHAFDVGSELWLKITGVNPIRANSVWTDGDRTGLKFSTPLALPEIHDLPGTSATAQKRIFLGGAPKARPALLGSKRSP
jgi:hypothetical protein